MRSFLQSVHALPAPGADLCQCRRPTATWCIYFLKWPQSFCSNRFARICGLVPVSWCKAVLWS